MASLATPESRSEARVMKESGSGSKSKSEARPWHNSWRVCVRMCVLQTGSVCTCVEGQPFPTPHPHKHTQDAAGQSRGGQLSSKVG